MQDDGGADASDAEADGDADTATCEPELLAAERVRPEVLFVVDASGSMVGLSPGGEVGVDRWSPTVSGVSASTLLYDDAFQFGLMVFPAGGTGCQPGVLEEGFATHNASAVEASLLAVMPSAGLTPLSATLEAARTILQGRDPVPLADEALAQRVVVLTDGHPTCVDVADPFTVLQGTPDEGARAAALAAIQALSSDGVETHVIGIDTEGSSVAPFLDSLAAAGGTNTTTHSAVAAGDVGTELAAMLRESATCALRLPEATQESQLRVRWTADGTELSNGSDWSLDDDGLTVSLAEDACDALLEGAALEVESVCEASDEI